MNLVDTSYISLLIEILFSLVLVYFFLKMEGYIFCNVFKIECDTLFYSVFGFFASIVLFAIIFILCQFVQIKIYVTGYCYITICVLASLLFFIIYRKKIKLSDVFGNKEEMAIIAIVSFIQIIIMYLSVDIDSIEDTTWVVIRLSELMQGKLYNGNILTGINVVDDSISKIYMYDMFIASISNVLHTHMWITYHVVMGIIKIVLYSIIVFLISKCLYDSKEKRIGFSFVYIIAGLFFYSGGSDLSPFHNCIVGEGLYAVMVNTDMIILLIAMPSLIYVLLLLTSNNNKKTEKLLTLIVTGIACIKYTGAFLVVVITFFYICSQIVYTKKIKKYLVIWLKISIVPFIIMIIMLSKMKVTYFLYFKDIYKEVWNYNSIVILLLFFVIGYFLYNIKYNKSNLMYINVSISIVIPSILIMIVLMNPISTKFTGKFLGYADIQNKILWCIPVIFIISYGLVEIYTKYEEFIGIYMAGAIILVLQLHMNKGWMTDYSNQDDRIINNIDKMMQASFYFQDKKLKDVDEFIKSSVPINDQNECNVYLPYDLSYRMMIYDHSFNMPYAYRCYLLRNTLSREEALNMYMADELDAVEVMGAYDTDLTYTDMCEGFSDSDVDYALISVNNREEFDNVIRVYKNLNIVKYFDDYCLLKIDN